MNISIFRKYTNDLYTEGQLYINGRLQTYTVEASANMLPAGTYTLHFVKKSKHKQSLTVHRKGKSTGISIGMGNSFITARKNNLIIIGTPHMHGAIYKSRTDYDRISDRIAKAISYRKPIFLTISDKHAIHDTPISWWSQTPDHGCPPTRQSVDIEPIDNEHSRCIIHCNDGSVKNLIIPNPES